MKFSSIYIPGILSLFLTACTGPNITFDWYPESIVAGQNMGFYTRGENASTYEWDFGDGLTAQGKEVSHAYKEPGKYEVTFTAKRNFGYTIAKRTLEIAPYPVLDPVGMNTVYAKTNALNLWWGVYGIMKLEGWEDVAVYTEDDRWIASFSLETKSYLRLVVEEDREDAEAQGFVQRLERFLADTIVDYRYYYDVPGSASFYEVPYEAPRNGNGVKPSFADMMYPVEGIDLSAVRNATATYLKDHFGVQQVRVVISDEITFEEALTEYWEEARFRTQEDGEMIRFTEAQITHLSQVWGVSLSEAEQRVQQAVAALARPTDESMEE